MYLFVNFRMIQYDFWIVFSTNCEFRRLNLEPKSILKYTSMSSQ